MLFNIRHKFATTIALFSGGPQYDVCAGRIINNLKKISNNSVSFVGVIGDQYKSSFDHVYASSAQLGHQEIIINRHYNQVVQDSMIIPYRTLTHYKNYKLMKKLRDAKIYDDISSRRVDALITVGNYSLMKRIYTGLNQFFEKSNRVRPVTFGFDLLNCFRTVENEEFLDFLFYNLPKQPLNYQNYTFPSMCIGYDGLFKAFKFLNNFNSINKDGSFKMDDFSYNVSNFIRSARNHFRSERNISEDTYITLFDAGNNTKEINFSFKVFDGSLRKFIEQPTIKQVDPKFFELFILLPNNQALASLIKNKASIISSKFKITFIQQNNRYAAMCASDFALLVNGQVTVEAGACQLPATVISNMPNYKAYMTYLYNGFDSPLNVSTNYLGYQDLLGSLTAIPQKISDLMLRHFDKPKLRYYYAKLYRQHIQKMILMSGYNPQMKVDQTGTEIAAMKIIESANIYHSLDRNKYYPGRQRRKLLNV